MHTSYGFPLLNRPPSDCCCRAVRMGAHLIFQGLAKMKEKLEAEADHGTRVVSVGVSVSGQRAYKSSR